MLQKQQCLGGFILFKYSLIWACSLSVMLVSSLYSAPQNKQTIKNIPSISAAFEKSRLSEALRQYWESYYISSDSGKKFRTGTPYYPTEPAIILLSAWICTKEQKYRDAAQLQFEFAHSRENDDNLLITELGFNRDTGARQIYNFYAAYKILGDKKYLTWADNGAQALLKHMPRRLHQVYGTNISHTLFAAGYCKPEKPYDTSSLNPWVDVNQNAELALAYTLLYFEPKSAFFKSAIAKEIVVNEMEAGLAIQNAATGAIPIGDNEYWIAKYDTLYGSYGLFSWTWLNIYWKNPEWRKHIESAGRWLAGISTGQGRMAKRYYPAESDSLELVDLWCRIPALWQIRFSPERIIDSIYGGPGSPNSSSAGSYAPFAYFELMKIPPEFYLRPKSKS